jgi:hypothetical protein
VPPGLQPFLSEPLELLINAKAEDENPPCVLLVAWRHRWALSLIFLTSDIGQCLISEPNLHYRTEDGEVQHFI